MAALILAIDSSSLVATVAIVSRDTVIAEYTTNLEKTHSQTLLPMIDEIFKMTGLDKKNLKAVAVTNGPGSFTGLRIGAATAKGITLALNIPIISIPTLEATAYNMNFTEKLICPIMDARRHQVYTGIFRCKETTLEAVMPSNAMALEDFLSELNKLGEEVVFIGDGIPVFKDEIDKELNVKHFFARQPFARQRAACVGSLAWDYYDEGKVMDSDAFAPMYYRLSQAEREKNEKSKCQNI